MVLRMWFLDSSSHRRLSKKNYGLNHFDPLPESLRLTKANCSPHTTAWHIMIIWLIIFINKNRYCTRHVQESTLLLSLRPIMHLSASSWPCRLLPTSPYYSLIPFTFLSPGGIFYSSCSKGWGVRNPQMWLLYLEPIPNSCQSLSN